MKYSDLKPKTRFKVGDIIKFSDIIGGYYGYEVMKVWLDKEGNERADLREAFKPNGDKATNRYIYHDERIETGIKY